MFRLPIISAFLLVLTIPAWCESPTSSVERLVKQLGSDSFAERATATKALNAVGAPALDALRKAIETSDDAEVRRRAKQVIESVKARLYGEPRCFKGHTDCVLSVSFSPDGKQALSGSMDKTVRLWDVELGIALRCFEGHTDVPLGLGHELRSSLLAQQ
jgi:WD40 repeat protein